MSYEQDLQNLMDSELAWRVFRRRYHLEDNLDWIASAILCGDYRRLCEDILLAQNCKTIKWGIKRYVKGLFKRRRHNAR